MNNTVRGLQFLIVSIFSIFISFSTEAKIPKNPSLSYKKYIPNKTDIVIDREAYFEKLQGFWLGTCIGNWTGLVTEMDKIGNIGEIKTGAFYTRHNWGQPDQPSIWGQGIPSNLSASVNFVYAAPDSVWGADDDTDIEYIYQELLLKHQTSILTGEQIREGWLRHIKHEEENYLWVSNQRAFDLMLKGLVPPATGDPQNNSEYEMIDAQLTTEIFGLFSPTRPDIALKIALLPVQTTARENSQSISEFYVSMFSLASVVDEGLPMKDRILWMAGQAKSCLPQISYAYKIFEYVKSKYNEGLTWEQTRDSIYYRYQVNSMDGYNMTSRKLYCNACFAAGINFAASLISLFYGEGDIVETIKIGTLAGWDSDNPTATWSGLLGFMIGRKGIEEAFNNEFSNRFNIHRTRTGFENDGIDTFENMALKGIWVVDRVVQEEMKGGVDLKKKLYYIPQRMGNPHE